MLEKFMNVFFKAPRQLDELRPKGPGYHLEFCKSFICEKGFQCKVMILYDGGDRTGLISFAMFFKGYIRRGFIRLLHFDTTFSLF